MRLLNPVVTLFLLLLASVANAELTIEITEGVDNPTPVAIVPFSYQGAEPLDQDIAEIVASDLKFSGLFDVLPKGDMLSYPSTEEDVLYREWRALGRDYVLVGSVELQENKSLKVRYYLFDILRQKKLMERKIVASKQQMRDIAHKISDKIYEELTNVRGAFSTKILYVSGKVLGNGRYNYKLYKSDFDGERKKLVLNSSEPILSPTWSPDGKEIVYVSFEKTRPAIFRQILATGERERLTHFPGMNSSPAYSPDGKYLAMVLSKDGSPDIYVMNLKTRKLVKYAANNFAIDTEPAWMLDGKSLVFTSNRGGKPQIYQVDLKTDTVKRLTFQGKYNARAQPLADGSGFILVHQDSTGFHIARFDQKKDRYYVLTSTKLDESPSISANGSMVMYAAKRGHQGVLAVVSVDGNVKTILPSAGNDDVREPAWSPFM